MVKNLPVNAGHVVEKIPWRRKWQPRIGNPPVFLSGKSHGQRGLADHSLWGCKRVRHDLGTTQKQHVSSANMRLILCRNLVTT